MYCYMTVLCCLFFLPFFVFFCLAFFFLCCLSVFIRFQFYLPFCPNNFFSFFTYFFLWLLFHLLDLYIITTIFLTSVISLSLVRAYSMQLSSSCVINNDMLFDLVLNFKSCTMFEIFLEPVVSTSVLIFDLGIVVIFIRNVCIFVYIFSSIGVFFHYHSKMTGLQGKREGIYLTPH